MLHIFYSYPYAQSNLFSPGFLLCSSPQHDIAALKAAGKLAKDPFDLVEKDVSTLSGGIKDLLGSDHPVLESCAK